MKSIVQKVSVVKKTGNPFVGLSALLCLFFAGLPGVAKAQFLKEAFKHDFVVGAALSSKQIAGKNEVALSLVKEQFNSIVAENCMKCENIQPKEGEFDFRLADQFVRFGSSNKMKIIGHTLVWHSQVAPWMFVDEEGKRVSKEVLIKRMRSHIHTVVGRYKGRVHGWDVVNEALAEDGKMRKSPWYTIIGPEYIELAFRFAHEADPTAALYYNDYNLYHPAKRAGVVRLIRQLKAKGCRIDAVGEQGHYGLDTDVFRELENSIVAFSAEGVKVMITELDVTVLPFPSKEITAEISTSYQMRPEYNPYTNGLSADAERRFTDYYLRLFNIFVKHRDAIDRVTFWGVGDGESWRNGWPIRNRTDYPLLFDRAYRAKPVVGELIRAQVEGKRVSR